MPKIKCFKKSFPIVNQLFLEEIQKQMKNQSVLSMQAQSTVKKHMLAYWNHGHIQSRIESWGANSISARIEYIYPLLDRRILEFMLGIPVEHFVNNGVGRYLFKSAVDNLFRDDLKIEKINEPNRVQRLINMTLVSCTRLVKQNEKKKKEPSKYIDEDKLAYILDNIQSRTRDKKSMYLVEDIEITMPLYFL